ncbi:MAG: hypothetical protein GX640_22005, partial [Fibrobacter sp.]|nr:hypothetical protein [Fibrobacter sp.]
MSNLAMNGSIEEVRLVYNPLDILAQVLLSMIGVDSWNIDNLYNFIKTCSSFSSLPKAQFDSVLIMLAGKYQETRIRELNPRIIIDPVDNTVYIRSGMLSLLYSNSGTIPDKGYYELRVSGSDALIGELDEEFVWERRTGDTFMIGTQSWKIEDIGDKAVKVSLYNGKASMSPFWKAEANNRSFHVSESISAFLETWNNCIDSDEFKQVLKKDYCMDHSAAETLSSYLQFQKKFTGEVLPHRHHLIIEHVSDAENDLDKYTILHTLWGNRVNYPFMLAFSAAWEERFKKHLENYSSNDTIYFAGHIGKEEIISLINSTNLNDFLVKSIQNTSFFGARFRENSSRALLLPRLNRNRRMPLWVTRQRAKKLFDHVAQYRDFPLIFETWRSCLNDEFDLTALRMILDELSSGKIEISIVNTSVPSPFSGFVKWQVTNKLLYEEDTLHTAAAQTTMQKDLIQEVIGTPSMRPEITGESIRYLQMRLQRTEEGYAPANTLDLLDWLRERRYVPKEEWEELLYRIKIDNPEDGNKIIEQVQPDIFIVKLQNAKIECFTTIERLADLLSCFKLSPDRLEIHDGNGKIYPADRLQRHLKKFTPKSMLKDVTGTIADFISLWLQYYGPLAPSFIKNVFGLTELEFNGAVKVLVENKNAVTDIVIAGENEPYLCDNENFERLLRIIRNRSRAAFKALPGSQLSLFLAHYQGLTRSRSGVDALKESLSRLFGLPCKYNIWESDIFSSRVSDYIPSMLDSLFREHEIQWFGCGKKQIAFRFSSDEALMQVDSGEPETTFPDKNAKYTFMDLLNINKTNSRDLSRMLWKDVWAGTVSNDTFKSVRNCNDEKTAINGSMQPDRQEKSDFSLNYSMSSRKMESFNEWKARLDPGNWYVIKKSKIPGDPLILHEQQKERVRILLNRYGILFKELLVHESPCFQWGTLFRTLRLMELSGEIINGHFFEDIPGLQFTSVTALKLLQEKLPQDGLYWINAADPVSLCGISIPAFKSRFPER